MFLPSLPSAQLLKEPRLELLCCCNGAGMKPRGPAAWSSSLTLIQTHTDTHLLVIALTPSHALAALPCCLPCACRVEWRLRGGRLRTQEGRGLRGRHLLRRRLLHPQRHRRGLLRRPARQVPGRRGGEPTRKTCQAGAEA